MEPRKNKSGILEDDIHDLPNSVCSQLSDYNLSCTSSESLINKERLRVREICLCLKNNGIEI